MELRHVSLLHSLQLLVVVSLASGCVLEWGYGNVVDASTEDRNDGGSLSYGPLNCDEFQAEAESSVPSSCIGGQIFYQIGRESFRSTLGTELVTENISECLNAHWPGTEEWVMSSAKADWLLTLTNRFLNECADWACLAVMKADLSEVEILTTDGEPLHVDSVGAIASGGSTIIYPLAGPHAADLYAISRSEDGWTVPLLLTGDSSHQYNLHPSISNDGTNVVFDCGADSGGQSETNICGVKVDGSGFRVV